MKLKYIPLLLATLVLTDQAVAQIKGETDMVDVPQYGPIPQLRASSGTTSCSDFDSYDCGLEHGYWEGYEAGRDDAEGCHESRTRYGFSFPGYPGQSFIDGHYYGWFVGYEFGYNERIGEKAGACQSGYTFNEFFCECSCIVKHYEYDHDNDGYYDPNTFSRFECTPPNSRWKPIDELHGTDCNDQNPEIWNYNVCGHCTEDSGITNWYSDKDEDGYHSLIVQNCSKPANGNWQATTLGEDCDDEDIEANIEQTWYYFKDEDTYYGSSTTSCLRPSEGIPAKWSTDPKSGEDCNDDDSNIIGPIDWYYDNDGDGYHSNKKSSCKKPETGDYAKWIKITSGWDCDDSDNTKFRMTPCGTCGNQESSDLAYIDFDGDGYHSIELNFSEISASAFVELPEFRNKYDWYRELTSPCLSIPLLVEIDVLNDHRIFLDIADLGVNTLVNDFGYDKQQHKIPRYGIRPIWQELSVYAENFHIRLIDTRYHNDVNRRDMYFADYIVLPDGKKLWVERNHNIGDPEWWRSPEQDWSLRVLLSDQWTDHHIVAQPWKGANFVIGSTLGLDCDDLDNTKFAYGDWYVDMDRDGYHDPETSPIQTCDPPNNQWIHVDNSLGPDCNDKDNNAMLLITWYYDYDLDNYYSTISQGCENPGKGTDEEVRWRSFPGNGEDCDDTDSEATTSDRTWYYDGDGDNYYGITEQSCKNPAKGTPDELKWTTDPGGGLDCDDINPDKQTENACGVCGGSDEPVNFYVDMDGDGYHSVVKFEDCGLREFSGELVRNSGFPESRIPERGVTTIIYVPGSSSLFAEYYDDDGEDLFYFPEEVLTYHSLGEDCDDFDPEIKADGTWYPDVDRDGYHDATAPSVTGCVPPSDAHYLLLENSEGPDCDDKDPLYHVAYTWYKDLDGDGYFTGMVEDCRAPGWGWSRTSGIGPDDDDSNPFTPAYSSEEFIVPSLLTEVTVETERFISYLGVRYPVEDFSIYYRGVELGYEDIIFDRVSSVTHLSGNKLVLGNEGALYEGQILITKEGASVNARLLSQDPDPVVSRKETEWIKGIIALNEGNSHTWGDVVNVNEEVLSYFGELLDPEKFSRFRDHYAIHGPPPFAVRFVTFEETLGKDGLPEKDPKPIIDETLGEGEPALIFYINKALANDRVEFVISIRDDSFKATQEELKAPKGTDENGNEIRWVDDAGNWINPEDEQEYLNQLALIQRFRLEMPTILAMDYKNDATAPDSPEVPTGLPKEEYPEYNTDWGLLSKWMEFFEVGHHMGHHFEMPEGVWNPEAEGDGEGVIGDGALSDSKNAPSQKWRTTSPASVAGIIDASLGGVSEIADMVKLGQSLVFGDTWEEIVGSQQSFSSGDHISRMIGLHEKVTSEQAGVSNELRFYVLGEFFTRTIQPTGPDDQPKILPETSRISPVNALKQKQQTVDDFFSKIFDEGISQNCSFAATEKFIDVYFNESSGSAFFDISAYLSAFYHSLFELARCQTSREQCEAEEPKYWQSFGCGAANALIEEGDIIGILESLSELSRTVISNLLNCVKDGGAAYLIVTAENADERINEAFKCYLGLDIKKEDFAAIYSSTEAYVTGHLNDPYTHGQATIFILSIVIPTSKITKAKKVRLVNELADRTEFKDIADDLRKLADTDNIGEAGRVLDELATGRFLSIRLSDPVFSALKNQVDQLDITLKIKFSKDFADVSDDVLLRLQEGDLVEAWRVLGKSADLRKNINALETIEFYTKNVNGDADELTEAFKAASNKEDWFSGIITEIRSKARSLPGITEGNGVVIDGKWMRGTEGNAGLFPKSVADKLKGKNFQNFDEFRGEFWKTAADDSHLVSQFSLINQNRMRQGLAPRVAETQQLGGRLSFEIHHKTPIHSGGAVYDMDNMVIVTPRYHKEILDPAYHFNN